MDQPDVNRVGFRFPANPRNRGDADLPLSSRHGSVGAAGAHRVDAQVWPFVDAERGAREREQTRCEPRRKRAGGAQIAVQATVMMNTAGDGDVELSEVRPGADVAGNNTHQHRGEGPRLATNVEGQDL